MPTSPGAIREALATYITTNIPGLRGLTDPGTIANPPVAVVLPVTGTYIDYAVALEHGVAELNLRVVILVSRASERMAMPLLDSYLAPYGASSVPEAILADPTLGGACDYCIPVEAVFAGDVNWAGIDYLGAEIICRAGAE
jgi:hypothetical protein